MKSCPHCGTPDAAPPVCKRCGSPVAEDKPAAPLGGADPSRYEPEIVAAETASAPPDGVARFPNGEFLDTAAAIPVSADAEQQMAPLEADAEWFEAGEEILVVYCERCQAQVDDDGGRFCSRCGFAVRDAKPDRSESGEGNANDLDDLNDLNDLNDADEPVSLRCLYCGLSNPRTRRACVQCGTRL